MAHQPLYGYPAPAFRDKLTEVIDVAGPASYINGTGQVIAASVLGWGGFDAVFGVNTGRIATQAGDVLVACLTLSGTYFCTFRIPTTAAKGQAAKQVTIWWYNVSDFAEVTNETDLSAERIRTVFVGV